MHNVLGPIRAKIHNLGTTEAFSKYSQFLLLFNYNLVIQNFRKILKVDPKSNAYEVLRPIWSTMNHFRANEFFAESNLEYNEPF